MLKCLFFLLLSFNCFYALAQDRMRITGFVRDSLKEPILFAQVYVQKTDSISVVAFGSTNSEGAFSFSAPLLKNFIVKANLLGFEAKIIRFENNEKSEISIHYNLSPKTFTLKETIVRASSTIQKSDTTTFSADKFRDSTDRTIDQVIAKLPGVEVNKTTGAISVQGKSIKKILFEGDDMTGRNYQLISQNMPADAIDKIQLIDKFVENKQLKGIKNSDDIVINLTLKENKRYLFFGTANVGAGNDDRYESSINLIGAFKKLKTLSFGSYNSVGRISVAENMLHTEFKEDGEAEAQRSLLHSNNSSIINFGTVPDLGLNSQSVRFNKAALASTLFVLRPIEKLVLKGGITFSRDNMLSYISNDQKYLLPDSSFVLSEQNINQSRPNIFETHFDAQFDASDKLLLRYKMDVRKSLIDNSAQAISNGNTIANILNTDIFSAANTFDLTYRINNQQALTANASFVSDNNRQNYALSQSIDRTVPFGKAFSDALNQNISRSISYFSFNGQWLYNYNNLQIATYTGFVQRVEKSNSLLSPYYRKVEFTLSDSFENITNFNQENYYVGLNLNKILFGIKLGLDVSAGYQKTESGNNVLASGLYVLPTWLLQKKFSDRSNLLFTYGLNYILPQTQNLLNSYILNDYRTLTRGDTALVAQNSNTFVAYYKYGNFANRYSFYINLIHNRNNGGYRSDLTVNNNYNFNTQVPNFLPSSNTTVRVGLDNFISILHWRLKIIPSYSLRNYQNNLNGSDTRQTDAEIKSVDLTISSGYLSWFNFHAGSNVSFSNNTTTSQNLKTTTGNQSIGAFIDFTMSYRSKFFVRIENELFSFKQTTENVWQKYYFSNASINYTAINNKLGFSIDVKNILNTTEFINSSATDYYIQTNRIRLLPRYFLFSINYHF